MLGVWDFRILLTHQRDQFVMDDLHHLLARSDTLDDFFANGFGRHFIKEITRHLDVDVRF